MKNKPLTLVVVLGFLYLTPNQAQTAEMTSLAKLDVMQQALVSAGLGAEDERYHARAEGDGFILDSPAQGLTAFLGGTGVEVRGLNGVVGMNFLGWGCAAALVPATNHRVDAKANRVNLLRDGITEWYVAGPLGVEQGFTIVAPAADCEAAEELVIELAIAGPMVLGKDGRSLGFPDAGLLYRGLVAIDSTGQHLPAHLELDGQKVRIRTAVVAAHWPVIVDPTFEVAKLLASDGQANHSFGESAIAVSGNTIVVGATSTLLSRGEVYVFTEPVGGWAGTLKEAAKLVTSEGALNTHLGSSVAISDSTVVAGAVGAEAAYVFIEPIGGWAGTLNEAAKLLASDAEEDDDFGVSIGVSGSTVVVGSFLDDDNGFNSGSAYVFTEPVGGWAGTLNEAAKLLASDGEADDHFGVSVAVSGDTVIVGTPLHDSGDFSGAAYVFTKPVGGWAGTLNETANLVANDGDAGGFGFSISLSGSTAVVGNPGGTDHGTNSGSAYVFVEPLGGWTGTVYHVAKLLASDGAAHDVFGTSVAISSNTVVVGAAGDDDSGNGSGSAYVFTKPVGGWAGTLSEAAKLLAPDGAPADLFGHSVAVFDKTSVVSAPSDDDNGFASGSAYVFSAMGPEPSIDINAGHGGAWFNPDTPGQGQLIDIEPEVKFMFLSWFTFTDADSANPNEQHWFTAQGNYLGNTAELLLYETTGGQFDDPKEVSTEPVGEVTLSFTDCGLGQMSYTIDTWNLEGSLPLRRAIPGAENVCQEQAGISTEPLDPNDGWDGAWFDQGTPGQGFLIDAHPNPEGDDFIFVAWFTYGEDTASGQRWLTAQGPLSGSTADLVLYKTTGGSFDDPTPSDTNPVGSLTIDFTDCSNALLTYALSDEALEGSIDIDRAIPGSEALCEELAGQIE